VAWLGAARHGLARPGLARRGPAWRGKAGGLWPAIIELKRGGARLGGARRGKARQGKGRNAAERETMAENQQEHDLSVFKGGMPYEPDVKRLEENYPVQSLTEGLVIDHKILSAIVKCKQGTGRYYGVIDSWRKKLRNENGIMLLWKQGVGLYVAHPHEILQHSEKRVREHLGGVRRGIKIIGHADRERLDELGKQRYDHTAKAYLFISTAVEQGRKQLPYEVPAVKSLPKPKIG